MFQLPAIGSTLAVSHYLAVLCVGLLMRFHARMAPPTPEPPSKDPVLSRALRALYEARQRDGRPIGTLFGDAVRESMGALFFIGGTIMMFSVLIRLLAAANVVGVAAALLRGPFALLGVDETLIHAALVGLVEITNGAKVASVANAPLAQKIAVTSGIIAWSGLSVHTQVAAMLHGTNIRIGPYIISRAVHAVLAAGFAWVLMGPGLGYVELNAVPVFAPWWAMEALSFGGRLFHAVASASQFALLSGAVVGAGALIGKLSLFWAKIK